MESIVHSDKIYDEEEKETSEDTYKKTAENEEQRSPSYAYNEKVAEHVAPKIPSEP